MQTYITHFNLAQFGLTDEKQRAFIESNAISDWAAKAFDDTGARWIVGVTENLPFFSVRITSEMTHRLDWIERDFAIAMPIAIKQFLQETK